MKQILILAGLLSAGSSLAQTPPPAAVAPPAPPAPMTHPMADRVMTRAETVAMVREHFGRMDADKDGSITVEEATKGHEHMRMMRGPHGEGGEHHAMRLERRDPNAAFDRLDTNKDGAISRDEFAKGHQERVEKRIEIREKHKEAGDDRRERRMHRGGMMGSRMIVMADSNKDGRITLAEAEAMALQHFDQMDANRDGQVTREERRAGRPMIIKKMNEEKKTAG